MPLKDPIKRQEYNKQYLRDHYKRNTSYYSLKRNKYKVELKKKKLEYLQNHPCVDCGESDTIVLDFDHVRSEKEKCISDMLRRGNGWATILKEIQKKCEVRCANCHRRITAKRRSRTKPE